MKLESELEKIRLNYKDEEVRIQAEITETEAKEKVYFENEESSQKDDESQASICSKAQHFRLNEDTTKTRKDLFETLVTFTMKNSMPKTQIKTFDGDYSKFSLFLKSFDSIITSKLTDDEEKIYYLSQYTSGKPHEIVKACMHLPHGIGYKEARKSLEKRYGNSDLIVTKYINSILTFQNIRNDDVEKLDEFSLLLINCKNAISKISSSVEVQHPKTMREILKKLPFSMQEKWRWLADDILEKQKR